MSKQTHSSCKIIRGYFVFLSLARLWHSSLTRYEDRQRGNRKTEWTDCFLFALILHAAFLDGFFLPAFFLRVFFSLTFYCELFSCELSSLTRLFSPLWNLYLKIVLDGRYRCAVIVCTGSLLRLLTIFLVLYCRSLTALLPLFYRFLSVTCIFCAASINRV